MLVKLKSIMAGPDGNHQPGDIVDFDKKLARQLIDGRHAEEVKPAKVAELASLKPPETAARSNAEAEAQANLQRIADAEKAAALEAALQALQEKIAATQAFIASKEAELVDAADDAKPGLEEVLAAAREELASLEAQLPAAQAPA